MAHRLRHLHSALARFCCGAVCSHVQADIMCLPPDLRNLDPDCEGPAQYMKFLVLEPLLMFARFSMECLSRQAAFHASRAQLQPWDLAQYL